MVWFWTWPFESSHWQSHVQKLTSSPCSLHSSQQQPLQQRQRRGKQIHFSSSINTLSDGLYVRRNNFTNKIFVVLLKIYTRRKSIPIVLILSNIDEDFRQIEHSKFTLLFRSHFNLKAISHRMFHISSHSTSTHTHTRTRSTAPYILLLLILQLLFAATLYVIGVGCLNYFTFFLLYACRHTRVVTCACGLLFCFAFYLRSHLRFNEFQSTRFSNNHIAK